MLMRKGTYNNINNFDLQACMNDIREKGIHLENLKTKKRAVNPEVLFKNQIKRLSEIN